MKFRTPIPIHVQLWTNRVKVTRLDTEKFHERESIKGVSNSRNVFAEFEEAERIMNSFVKELEEKRSIFSRSYAFAMQQMERTGGGHGGNIKRALDDSAEHVGAKYVVPIEDETEQTRHFIPNKLTNV